MSIALNYCSSLFNVTSTLSSQCFENDDGTVAFHAKTKKKDDESKFFVGFDADGSISNPELTGNDDFGRFIVVPVGHRHQAK
jgi:hypothetical protein